MDLLQTVRKEGSRGGRANFTWDEVKNDTQRENYLGHSLMAPVGRWQKGRDLQWYARNKDGDDGAEKSEAEKRKEEIRKVKQQEEDAMARALGYDVPPRGEEGNGTGANGVPVDGQKEVQRVLKESAAGRDEDGETGGQGLGAPELKGPDVTSASEEREVDLEIGSEGGTTREGTSDVKVATETIDTDGIGHAVGPDLLNAADIAVEAVISIDVRGKAKHITMTIMSVVTTDTSVDLAERGNDPSLRAIAKDLSRRGIVADMGKDGNLSRLSKALVGT
ncbi:MAG: hypothetical protein Q9162_005619 [Coniocarpon cinnabarinum]